MTVAYIGLGSNLDCPKQQIISAYQELEVIPGTVLVEKSSMYRSAPLGPQNQPDFVNSAARLETSLSANILLQHLQDIENRHGRQRLEHWGPRTLDLDILLFGEMTIEDENLTVPHKEIKTRLFVLYPLLEIADDLVIPGLGKVTDLIKQIDDDPPVRIG